MHMSQRFGMHSVNVSPDCRQYDKVNLASKFARARARFTGVRGDYASHSIPNAAVLPHAAASIVTSTLTPFSTDTGAHFVIR